MLIVHGVSEKLLNYHEESSSICSNCNKQGITYRIVQKYYHVFWIPFFPIGKYTGVNCDKCNYNNNQIVSENSVVYEKLSKTPIYLYTGSVIFTIIGLVISGIILSLFFGEN